jgi:hypothetical protein
MLPEHKGTENKQLTDSPEGRLQTSLQTNLENAPKQAETIPPELMKIVEAWPNLPEHIRQAIMALVGIQ